MPGAACNVLVSIAEENKRLEFLSSVETFLKMGYKLFCTPGTGDFYTSRGLEVGYLSKSEDDKTRPYVLDYIKGAKVEIVINIPEGTKKEDEITVGYSMRRSAVDFGVPLVTNIKCAILLVEALAKHKGIQVKNVQDYYSTPTIGWGRADALD